MAVCYYHPDRPGVGVCVRCRTVICAACSTRLDGINHCHRCLSKLAARAETKTGSFATSIVLGVVVLAVAWLILFGLFYLVGGIFAPTLQAAARPVQRLAGTSHAC
jgi:uncharacterized paraquat-inducible protein A